MFNSLSNLKKSILMLEYIRYGKEFSDKLFTDFIALRKTPQTEVEVENLIVDFNNLIDSYIPEAIKDFLDSVDDSVYLSSFHYRKYPNEIENDISVQYFLEKAFSVLEVSTDDSDKMTFSLRLYDFNDFDIYFENEEDAKEFISNNYIETCTSFEKEDNCWVESWSI